MSVVLCVCAGGAGGMVGVVDLLKVTEVQARLGVSESMVRKLVRRGDLAAVRIGSAVRVPADDVDRYLREALTPAGAVA